MAKPLYSDFSFNSFFHACLLLHNFVRYLFICHIADCGVPLVDRNVKLNYTSTLGGSILTLTCENEMSSMNTTDEQALSVTCHSNASWIPNPADFTCSSFTIVPPGTINCIFVHWGWD